MDDSIANRINEIKEQIDLKVESIKFEIDNMRQKLFEKLEDIKKNVEK